MHLTAISTAPQPALVSRLVCATPERNHLYRRSPSHRPPKWSESVFRSGVVNSLEMPSAGFHYSVIGGNVWGLLVCGDIDCRLLNDEVSASGTKIAAPDADAVRLLLRAQAQQEMNDASTPSVPVAFSSRRKKD